MCETAAGLQRWRLGLFRGIIRALDISKILTSEYVIRERTQLRHATPTQPYDQLLPDIGILVLQLLREGLLQHRGGEPNCTPHMLRSAATAGKHRTHSNGPQTRALMTQLITFPAMILLQTLRQLLGLLCVS